jgi:hypothetical protein
MFDECHLVQVFQHGEFNDTSTAVWRTTTNYWQEGSTSIAIPPESDSNFMSQHNKIGAITFGSAPRICNNKKHGMFAEAK